MGQADLPLAPGDAHARAFERCGWSIRQRRNHIILTKPGVRATLSIPDHREVKRALIAKLIKQAGMSEAEYLAAFHEQRRQ
jgi:predicted RNA binding protein YcfA (HicA-like mRNA interferase family)